MTKKAVNKTVKTPEQVASELKAVETHEAKIAELKKKYNVADVFTLKVGDAVGYVKKPGRAEVSMARDLGEGSYIKIQELLLDAIWLEGDERIRKDDDYFFNVVSLLENIIEAKVAELKKN